MQKLRVRNGCRFRCAWLPPVFAIACGDMATRFDGPA
jgi:hypothetical protein